jgi:glycosyltransferase involved in cell wall biosynthesis
MRADIPEVAATFDIGVVPSRQESFGMVLVELMSMKVPVVCSGKGGLAELVRNEETGLVTRENEPDEICLCVQRLAQDQGLRNRLAEAAYAFSKKFEPKEQIGKLEKVYKRLCSK